MKTTVNKWDFVQAFENMDRKDNFSNDGLYAMFEYFEQLEEDTDFEIELDVIAICCEYTEYENLEDFWDSYDSEEYDSLDTLRDYTQVIEIEGTDGFIIQDF